MTKGGSSRRASRRCARSWRRRCATAGCSWPAMPPTSCRRPARRGSISRSADVRVLARALTEFFRTGATERLDRYSDICLLPGLEGGALFLVHDLAAAPLSGALAVRAQHPARPSSTICSARARPADHRGELRRPAAGGGLTQGGGAAHPAQPRASGEDGDVCVRVMELLLPLRFLFGCPLAASAQDYPSRPIRPDPYAAGQPGRRARPSGCAGPGRTARPDPSSTTGRRGDQIAAEQLKRSPPDGYTLMISTSEATMLPFLKKSYRTIRSRTSRRSRWS